MLAGEPSTNQGSQRQAGRIRLGDDLLAYVFPFILEVDASLRLRLVGPLMQRICPQAVPGAALLELFALQGAASAVGSFDDLSAMTRKTLVMKSAGEPPRVIKGEWLPDAEGRSLWFLGWPWVMDADELLRLGIAPQEIPPHNPLGDLLFLLRTNRNTLLDTRELADRLKQRTQALEQANRRLDHLATHDALTGLPNRLLLEDRLTHAVEAARRSQGRLAVLFVDLDHFKNINDSLGHPVGDRVLREAGERIRSEMRASDTVARQGGDEFVVLLEDLGSEGDASLVADKIVTSLARPFASDGKGLHCGASIGIALFPDDGESPGELIRRADIALYEAKQSGRGCFRFCTAEINARVQRRFSIEEQLRQAIAHGEFELHYQPQVNMDSGRIAGVEALIRWRHPERGLLAPAEFIDIAEESGLIEPMGAWVIETACHQAARWDRQGRRVHVAVNVSPRQFLHGGLARVLRQAIDDSAVDPALLVLEVTESTVTRDPDAARRQLEAFKSEGVRIALDDFGTGHSNLRLLSSLPFDIIKIDRGFVQGLPSSREGIAIVLAIIDLAERLGLDVVAEGIETGPQHEFLQGRGRLEGQGYWYARPIDEAAMTGLLSDAGRRLPATPEGAPDGR